MNEVINFEDIVPVGNVGFSIYFFVRKEDVKKENPLCLEVVLGAPAKFYIEEIQKFGKFIPFEPIDFEDEKIVRFHRDMFVMRIKTKDSFEAFRTFLSKFEKE